MTPNKQRDRRHAVAVHCRSAKYSSAQKGEAVFAPTNTASMKTPSSKLKGHSHGQG